MSNILRQSMLELLGNLQRRTRREREDYGDGQAMNTSGIDGIPMGSQATRMGIAREQHGIP